LLIKNVSLAKKKKFLTKIKLKIFSKNVFFAFLLLLLFTKLNFFVSLFTTISLLLLFILNSAQIIVSII